MRRDRDILRSSEGRLILEECYIKRVLFLKDDSVVFESIVDRIEKQNMKYEYYATKLLSQYFL